MFEFNLFTPSFGELWYQPIFQTTHQYEKIGCGMVVTIAFDVMVWHSIRCAKVSRSLGS